MLCVSLALVALASAACHPGPVVDTGPRPPGSGTIAGIVSTDGNAALSGRKVTAVDTASGSRFEATTGNNGGYTIKVPEGTYRLEVELHPGEKVSKQPDETRVNRSDLGSPSGLRDLRRSPVRRRALRYIWRSSRESTGFEPYLHREGLAAIVAAVALDRPERAADGARPARERPAHRRFDIRPH